MKIVGRLALAENATTGTGTAFPWQGGKGKVFIEATFQTDSSITIQFKSPNGTWIDYPNGVFTANGILDIELPPCEIRAVLSQVLAAAKNISDISQADPAVVTATAHGYSNGDRVFITGVVGMVEVNDLEFIVANKTDDTFELTDIDSTGYTAYVSDGTAQKVSRASAAYAYAIGSHQ